MKPDIIDSFPDFFSTIPYLPKHFSTHPFWTSFKAISKRLVDPDFLFVFEMVLECRSAGTNHRLGDNKFGSVCHWRFFGVSNITDHRQSVGDAYTGGKGGREGGVLSPEISASVYCICSVIPFGRRVMGR